MSRPWTSDEMRAKMLAQGFTTKNVRIVDRTYSCTKLHWLRTTFWDELCLVWDYAAKRFGVASLMDYSNKRDCDNAARRYKAFVDDVYGATVESEADALAVGQFTYRTDSGGMHEIIFAWVMDHGVPELVFVEPQTGQQIHLSEKERAACVHWCL